MVNKQSGFVGDTVQRMVPQKNIADSYFVMTGMFTLGRRRDNPQCGHNESTGVDETPATEQIIRSLPTVHEQRLFQTKRPF